MLTSSLNSTDKAGCEDGRAANGRGVSVPIKTVDVFLNDRLVESYGFDWDIRRAPLFDQDFIDRARDRMRADNYSDAQIAQARFSVRDCRH